MPDPGAARRGRSRSSGAVGRDRSATADHRRPQPRSPRPQRLPRRPRPPAGARAGDGRRRLPSRAARRSAGPWRPAPVRGPPGSPRPSSSPSASGFARGRRAAPGPDDRDPRDRRPPATRGASLADRAAQPDAAGSRSRRPPVGGRADGHAPVLALDRGARDGRRRARRAAGGQEYGCWIEVGGAEAAHRPDVRRRRRAVVGGPRRRPRRPAARTPCSGCRSSRTGAERASRC